MVALIGGVAKPALIVATTATARELGAKAGALVGVASGLGKVRPGMVLSGVTDPVRVTPVKTTTPNAPTGLAAAFRRVPGASAQVAVEKYTMVGGATRYVAYIAGTRNSLPWQAGESEPWDMKSNVELYQGGPSASYQATLDALTVSPRRASAIRTAESRI